MKVLEISVVPDVRRIHIKIEMPDPNCFLTSQVPHLPRRLFRLLPRLREHTCDNPQSLSFRHECQNTEIPHLFEHLVLELQLQAQQNPDDLLSGETVWNWTQDPRGHYLVSVDYDNELLAVASIRLAERILAGLDRRDVSIDMDMEIARLRQIMLLGKALADSSTALPTAPVAVAPEKATTPRRQHRHRPQIGWATAPFMKTTPYTPASVVNS